MNARTKKLFENHAVKLSEEIAAERLKRADVVLAPGLGIAIPRSHRRNGFSRSLIKRLAGG